MSNLVDGASGNISITQGDGDDDDATFAHSGLTVKWRGGEKELTNTSGAIDIVSYLRVGTILYLTLGTDYQTQ